MTGGSVSAGTSMVIDAAMDAYQICTGDRRSRRWAVNVSSRIERFVFLEALRFRRWVM